MRRTYATAREPVMSDNRKCGHFLRSSNKLIELTGGAITCPWCEIAERDATIAELRFEVAGLKEALEQAAIRNTQIAEEGAEFRSELGAADGTIRELRDEVKQKHEKNCQIYRRLCEAETALAAARAAPEAMPEPRYFDSNGYRAENGVRQKFVLKDDYDALRAYAMRSAEAVREAKLWIDCEWNGYGGELISMALVADNGMEWYANLGCKAPEPWIAEHVMPGLAGTPTVSREYFQSSLSGFLMGFDAVHIIADWPEDIERFCAALIIGPGMRVPTPPITMEVRRDINSEQSALPHNALADARAMRDMYRALDQGQAVTP
jgi:hypothetical protein